MNGKVPPDNVTVKVVDWPTGVDAGAAVNDEMVIPDTEVTVREVDELAKRPAASVTVTPTVKLPVCPGVHFSEVWLIEEQPCGRPV